jgi:hypothetical protein
MSRIRVRAANNHDHYLNGQQNLLRLQTNDSVKKCPIFTNQLLASPWILGQYIARAGNRFYTIGGSGATANTSLEHRAVSEWVAVGDFSITYKKTTDGLASTSGMLGLDPDLQAPHPYTGLPYALLVTTDAASQPLNFYKAGLDGVANIPGVPVKVAYDVLFRIYRVGGVTKVASSVDCGITFVDKYTFATTTVPVVHANINVSDNNGSYTLVESVGFAPATPVIVAN